MDPPKGLTAHRTIIAGAPGLPSRGLTDRAPCENQKESGRPAVDSGRPARGEEERPEG
jgi:hypothetical protein